MTAASPATNHRKRNPATPQERLDAFSGPKNPFTNCIEWLGEYVEVDGHPTYGRIKLCRWIDGSIIPGEGRQEYAHRVSWMLRHGREIPEGMVIRHMCHNMRCVNADHLDIGTHADNSADEIISDRGPIKFKRGSEAIKFLDFMRAKGAKVDRAKIARVFGIKEATQRTIVKSEAWRIAMARAAAGERGDQ